MSVLGCTSRVRLMTVKTTHVDPEDLYSSPAFTQGVIAPAAQTLYVGGQLGTDSTGKLLDGIEAQSAQAMRNVLTVLAAAGTGPEETGRRRVGVMGIVVVDEQEERGAGRTRGRGARPQPGEGRGRGLRGGPLAPRVLAGG